jgi:hypothetical protein
MGSLSALLHGKEKAQNPNHFSYSKLGDAPVRYPLSAVLSVDGSIDPNSLAIFRRRREKSPQPHGGASLSRPDPSISFTVFTSSAQTQCLLAARSIRVTRG